MAAKNHSKLQQSVVPLTLRCSCSGRPNFTAEEEKRCTTPILHMYQNNNSMQESIAGHIEDIHAFSPNDIAVISFDDSLTVDRMRELTGKDFALLASDRTPESNEYILASPYAINGLEFKVVILVGVDEGRVPQTAGTSDISQHFIQYSAYNLLYLSASRAKYRLILLGNSLNGRSSCLEHSLDLGYIVEEIH